MDKTTLIPIEDRVAIREDEPETQTGQFIVPDSVAQKPNKGTVISVGCGLDIRPMVIKAGDRVVYPKRHGTEIDYSGEKILIIKQSDIYAIL